MKKTWKKLKSKIVYQNPWIKVREDRVIRPDGKKGIYGFLIKKPGIYIIAEDKNSFIYLVKEYRYPLKKVLYQLPGGVIERGSPLTAAKKELYEEIGIKARRWKNLGKIYSAPGHETTYDITYHATELFIDKIETKFQDGNEAIQEVVKIKKEKIINMIKSNKIQCGESIASFFLYFLNR